MQHRTSSRTKAVVGGLLAAGLALTAAVAMAAKGPNGGAYGYGGYGRANGHRLHCPSYNGMYHSKGRATCHMAPRRAGAATGEVSSPPDGSSVQSQASQSGPQAASVPNPRSNNPAGNNSVVRGQPGHPGQPGQTGQTGRPGQTGQPGHPPAHARHSGDLDADTGDVVDDTADDAAGRRGGNRQKAPKPQHP